MINNIFFDMDGTLFSTEPAIYSIYKRGIDSFKASNPEYSSLLVPSKASMVSVLGYPVKEIYELLFPAFANKERISIQNYIQKEFALAIENKEGMLFEGVYETILLLHKKQRLFIASNGHYNYIETILKTYALFDLFEPVITLDNISICDKGDILLKYKEKYNLPTRGNLMVGDRQSDLEASLKLGCDFVLCSYGHGGEDDLSSFKGEAISSLKELVKLV